MHASFLSLWITPQYLYLAYWDTLSESASNEEKRLEHRISEGV